MLKLRLAAALEGRHITICSETCWVPKTHRCLHTELVLKGSQRGCGVVGPVTPGASGQAVLAKASATLSEHARNMKTRTVCTILKPPKPNTVFSCTLHSSHCPKQFWTSYTIYKNDWIIEIVDQRNLACCNFRNPKTAPGRTSQ